MTEQPVTPTPQGRTPDAGGLLAEQMREVAYRTPWEYLALFGVMLLTLVLLRTTGAIVDPEMPMFIQGAVAWPAGLVLVLISIFWAIRVWSGLSPAERDYYLSRPVAARRLILLRVAAGLILFLGIFTVAWVIGAALGEILGSEEMRLANRAVQGWGWLLTLFGLVNAYLFGNIFAIRFRRPEQYVLGLILLSLFMTWVMFRVTAFDWLIEPVGELINSLFRGFGSAIAFGGDTVSPHPGYLLVWFGLYAGITAAAASIPSRK